MDFLKYQLKSVEKIPTKVWADAREGSKHVAQTIALSIRQRQQEGEHIVLGLATGSSPIQVYQELVRMHKEEGLSFKNVITFNLDEYYPMKPDAQQSYVRFMREYLFDHIDIKKENIHIPDGTLPIEQVEEYCRQYDKKIEILGGIDIQLLGIGRTGHIGFNEPGSWDTSDTRLVRLDALTRRDALKDFPSEEDVPYRAMTMGIRSILKAKAIHLLAWGQHKAEVVKRAVEDEITPSIPSSFLQKHPNTRFHVDTGAAECLTKYESPWLIGICNWDDDLICKAVIWLSQKVGKPILKLTSEDYNEHGLSDLTLEYAAAYEINIKIFNRLQHTITGWPGGKPNADDSTRPERAKPAKKRVIIFSPHPDDDVISMGGTFLRLVEQGHDVHVAYQTSGNIAVHDYDALRFVEFLQEYNDSGANNGFKDELDKKYKKILKFLNNKKSDEMDIAEVRSVKGLIRRGEARAGARFCGLNEDHIHFLDLPFYETGRTRKNPVGEDDVKIIVDLMEKIKPHQVFAAGDLADPHGTHRVCLDAIFMSFEKLKEESWIKDCWLWLYRGAWHEWSTHEIEMAVPISPEQLLKKRRAIFMHQSQKDRPPFPGNDEREFWQRAEDRNRESAHIYRKLGLAEYEAIEAFRRWKF
ncbi:glucosamine-6-phosphate deaminase [Haliscomenobacter hydrossis]|uniref:Glucosamine-6-phosphate deaminase n=1 Tax=Haliscomenobacter hydrossis (strain ATCC 27775 / DSM 1100 / LMG 10767 / O) TaxID=760192 RepID=F4KSL2_HALH1|nr:glucosamine-6-phosphate deaminase [Haliscomenobacter hydrossis]AEE54363.1 Glucosamine-6-phosphate deaminase [Haliscomenobacter hydrossis DSM 1100]